MRIGCDVVVGQRVTLQTIPSMSVLTPKADIGQTATARPLRVDTVDKVGDAALRLLICVFVVVRPRLPFGSDNVVLPTDA